MPTDHRLRHANAPAKLVGMTSTPETITLCPHCDEEVDAYDLGPAAYECGTCGSQFTSDESNRCPDCNRFAAKLADASCPECDEPIGGEYGEAEEREVYRSADGQVHNTADEAVAWDDPAATAERERKAAEGTSRAYELIAQYRRDAEA